MADSFKDIFGQTPGQLGVGAAGTFAGGALNYYFNSQLQDKQFAEQEKLQKNAAKLNAQAVQNQAQLQAQGMTNAGLNPAQVTGAGAPSVQAGAAAGANTQLASIFQGVAEIVAAAKAPSEVEKNISEAGKANAEADKATQEAVESATRTVTLYPAQAKQLEAAAGKLVEDTRTAKNLNDAWEAEDKYLRKQTQAVFSSVREQMQNSKRWDKLPQDVRIALDNLAEGNDRVGKGEYEAIMKDLKLRGEFSDTDMKLIENAYDSWVKLSQLNDPKVREALKKAPENQQNLIKAQMSELNALVKEINEGKIPLEKAQAGLADMEKQLKEVQKKIAEYNDALYLANEGRERELDNLTTKQSLDNLLSVLTIAISAVASAIPFLLNAWASKNDSPSTIQKPSESDIRRTHQSRNDGPNGATFNIDLSPHDDKNGPLIYKK